MLFGNECSLHLSVMYMKFNWQYQGEEPIKLKTFIKNQGLSRHLMAKVRHQGGKVLINGTENRKVDCILPGTVVSVCMPPEKNRKRELIPSYVPIDILYEDRDYLILNKPAHVNSIPSIPQPRDSMVNRVYGYYQLRGYYDIIPHIITRLDRDTSGVVLFAKHRYAAAMLTDQMQKHQIKKTYTAFLSGSLLQDHFVIDQPIGRVENSLIKRRVVSTGKEAQTEYFVKRRMSSYTICDVRLHTGRTHQIRVHSNFIGHPLVADTLYGSKINLPLQRQGLHCREIEFYHPFKQQVVKFSVDLPADMQDFENTKQ